MSADELRLKAYRLADAYRAGLWPELEGRDWDGVWAFLVRELGRQCPGFTSRECGQALNQGFQDSR
ncbi:MAG: hypothetical protein KKB20_26090 [Proteobacteria bacterium]|nr:hypothetical protein [Pseudomonadota bacterium]